MDKSQLDDKTLGAIVDAKIREAVGWFSSKLSLERERVLKFYNGELPKKQSDGNASYVSTDVYDGVEAMKAQLLETFAAGYDIVRFSPQNEDDVEPSRIATEYTDYVIFRQNDGYKIFSDVIHDGLISRNGIAKVYWDECLDDVEEQFENLTEDEVNAIMAVDEVGDLEAEMGEDGTYSGTLKKTLDKSQVRIEVVAPEEFCVDPQSTELNKDTFCVHRSVKSLADLIKAGYDTKKLKDYNIEGEDYFKNHPEKLARFSQIDSGYTIESGDQQDELRMVLVNECYIRLQLKGDKYPKLYKIVRVGSNTLAKDEVDDFPFVVFTPLPVPHAFYGNNYAARIIPTQNVTTVLTRSIIDHTSITNNPRYKVLKGGLTNPKELLDNRLGGIVNITRPDAIMPMEQAPMNPFVYQTLEMIKAKNEETTGISSLSQGLNKDAISKQNSAAMMENLVSLSQTRQKIVARNFGNGFLIPLWLKVYNLVLMKEKKERVVELSGNWVPVNPKTWRERRDATVSLHLGYGEQEKEAGKYTMLLSMAAQDPELSASMQVAGGKYNAAKKILMLNGIKDVSNFLAHPSKVPPPQPDPMMALEIKKMELEAKKLEADAAKAAAEAQIEMARIEMEKTQQEFDNMMALREADRLDADIANKIDVAQRELDMAEQAPPAEAVNAIVSPNS
jgi:hypothetical protein